MLNRLLEMRNDLAVDCPARRLIERKWHMINEVERRADRLADGPEARAPAEPVPRGERRHLQAQTEFVAAASPGA
jgi:hypothetical protein